MASPLKHFDPKELTVVVADIPLKGFMDGEFVKITPNAELWTPKVGSQGDVTRVKSNNRLARVEIHLMGSSDSNDLLSALYQLDDNQPNGAGVGAFLVKDRQGRSVAAGAECWIVRMPEVTYSTEETERLWLIDVAELIMFVGGR